MPKISTYSYDEDLENSDSWMGTDGKTGDTKQFSVGDVSDYIVARVPSGGGGSFTSLVNIEALKNKADPKPNEVMNVLGYYSKGDGGGGQFYWDEDSAELDDGGAFIQSNVIGSGRWRRVFGSGPIDISQFGAIGDYSYETDSGTDDSIPIRNAIVYAINNGIGGITLTGKKYIMYLNAYIVVGPVHFDITFKDGAELITVNGNRLRFTGSYTTETLLTDANFLEDFFISTDPDSYDIRDVVWFRSDEIAEDGWGYNSAGLYIVTKIDGNKIYLDRRLRFNFKVSDNATAQIIESKSHINIYNAKLVKSGTGVGGVNMQFVGLSNITIDNCFVTKTGGSGQEDGISFVKCYNVKISDFHGEVVRYPIVFAQSLCLRGSRISCINTRHLIECVLWAEDVVIDGFSALSREGGISAHPSFNITYKNGTTLDTKNPSNFRWFGGGCENVKITIGEDVQTSGVYSGILMSATNYPNYTKYLRELGLMANFENILVDDTKRADGGNYQSRGFNIGMSGTFNNIKHLQKPGLELITTYIEQRPLDLTLGTFDPPYIRNYSSVLGSFKQLNKQPKNSYIDPSDADTYILNVDSPNMEVVEIEESGYLTTGTYKRASSYGNLIPYSVHTSKKCTIKFNATNNTFGRYSQQKIELKLFMFSENGTAERTFNIEYIIASGTISVKSRTPTLTSDPIKCDIDISNLIPDPAVSFAKNQPFIFDVDMTYDTHLKGVFVNYECNAVVKQ